MQRGDEFDLSVVFRQGQPVDFHAVGVHGVGRAADAVSQQQLDGGLSPEAAVPRQPPDYVSSPLAANLVAVRAGDADNRPALAGAGDGKQQLPVRPVEVELPVEAQDALKVAPCGRPVDAEGAGEGHGQAPVEEP